MTAGSLASATLKVTTDNGVQVSVPVEFSAMSEAEKLAFLKFAALSNDKTALTPDELRLIEAGRVYLRGDTVPEGLICRWDWSCWILK